MREDDMKKKVILTFSIVLLVWSLSWFFVTYFLDEWTSRGTFGDMFGAVNALFSGLAFAGIIIALYLQKTELALQRKELRDTREELRGQKEQMELQNQSILKQNFENTFFQLLRFHNQIANNIDIDIHIGGGKSVFEENYKKLIGRDCFQVLYERLDRRYKEMKTKVRDEDESFINDVYKKFHEDHQSDIGYYFRNLYHMVKFVKDSDISNKEDYMNLIRAQLSTYEHLLLFYNCISELGNKKFKPLVEEFGLLNDMNVDLLIEGFHKNYYDPKAFGET